METVLWRKYFCGRKIAINDFCDEKKNYENFSIQKLEIVRKIFKSWLKIKKSKGNHAFADLRYGEEDSISPSTLNFAATKG